MSKLLLRPGLCPGPLWSLQHSPNPLVKFEGGEGKGKGKGKRRGGGKGREEKDFRRLKEKEKGQGEQGGKERGKGGVGPLKAC